MEEAISLNPAVEDTRSTHWTTTPGQPFRGSRRRLGGGGDVWHTGISELIGVLLRRFEQQLLTHDIVLTSIPKGDQPLRAPSGRCSDSHVHAKWENSRSAALQIPVAYRPAPLPKNHSQARKCRWYFCSRCHQGDQNIQAADRRYAYAELLWRKRCTNTSV